MEMGKKFGGEDLYDSLEERLQQMITYRAGDMTNGGG